MEAFLDFPRPDTARMMVTTHLFWIMLSKQKHGIVMLGRETFFNVSETRIATCVADVLDVHRAVGGAGRVHRLAPIKLEGRPRRNVRVVDVIVRSRVWGDRDGLGQRHQLRQQRQRRDLVLHGSRHPRVRVELRVRVCAVGCCPERRIHPGIILAGLDLMTVSGIIAYMKTTVINKMLPQSST